MERLGATRSERRGASSDRRGGVTTGTEGATTGAGSEGATTGAGTEGTGTEGTGAAGAGAKGAAVTAVATVLLMVSMASCACVNANECAADPEREAVAEAMAFVISACAVIIAVISPSCASEAPGKESETPEVTAAVGRPRLGLDLDFAGGVEDTGAGATGIGTTESESDIGTGAGAGRTEVEDTAGATGAVADTAFKDFVTDNFSLFLTSNKSPDV